MEETKKSFDSKKVEDWIKNHLWLFAIGAGCLVFFGLCGPLLTSKGVGFDSVTEEFSKISGRSNVYVLDLFKGSVWCYPILLTYLLVLAGTILAFLGKKWKNCYIAAMFALLCSGIFFFLGNALFDFTSCASLAGFSYDVADYANLSETKLAFGAAWSGILSFVAASICLGAANVKDSLSVYDMTEMGILCAMAIGLQFIKITVSSGAGSINLGLIPLFIIALRQGPTKGFIAGAFIYGIVTCLTDGWGFFTYPLDYLVGFGSVAVLGFFTRFIFIKDEKGWNWLGFAYLAIGIILASLVRFVGGCASSMLNYGLDIKGSLLYNILYVGPTGAISYAALAILYLPLARLQKVFPPRSSLASNETK